MRVHAVVILSALIFPVLGFGAEQERVKVQVIRDPALIAAARKRAKARDEEEVRTLVVNIDNADYEWDSDTVSRHRERLEKELLTIHENPKSSVLARVNSCIYLSRISGRHWLDRACDLVPPNDPIAVELVLMALQNDTWVLRDKGRGTGPSAQIRSFLLGQVATENSRFVRSAVYIGTDLGIPEIEERVRTIAGKMDADGLDAIMGAAAKFHPDAGTLDYIEKGIFGPDAVRQTAPHYLTEVVKNCTPEIKPRAMELLKRYVVQQIENHKDPTLARPRGDLYSEVEAFGKNANVDHLAVLKEWIAEKRVDAGTRGKLLADIVRLIPPADARELLLMHLQTDLRPYAIRSIAISLKGSKDTEAIRALARTTKPKLQYDYDTAVTADAIGGPESQELIKAIVPRLTWYDLQRLQVALGQVTPDQVIDAIQKRGLLDRASEEELLKLRKTNADWTAWSLVASVLDLAQRRTRFDTEIEFLPARHDGLIRKFARGSAGEFRPETTWEVMEQKDEDDLGGPYIVEFIWNERLYRFQAQNFRRRYDTTAVVIALNQALEDAARKERFIELSTGDCAEFIFADPAIFCPVADELMIPTTIDADSWHRINKAFKERVLQDIERKK